MSRSPDVGPQPYADEYAEGRRAGMAGLDRDLNPYFYRVDDATGTPDSHEVWRNKYDVWRQGWMEGHSKAGPDRAQHKAADDQPHDEGKSQR